jgi:hypothetical protein
MKILPKNLNSKDLKKSYQNKILIWTWTSLHDPSGTPAILYNLIKELVEYEFYYFHGQKYSFTKTEPQNLKVFKRICILEGLDYSYRPFLQLLLDFIVRVPLLTLWCIYCNLKYGNNAILSVFYNRCWVYSGYLASKILRKKYIVYCHDPFSEKYLNSKGSIWRASLKIERMVLSDKNTTVFCLNEGMKRLYEKYTDAIVLPHIAEFATSLSGKIQETINDKFTIGFAGSIYSNNDECIDVLLSEAKHIDNIKLKFYGNYSEDIKKRITSIYPVEFDFKNNYNELIQGLQNCDLLYLPLNFRASTEMPRECLQYVLPTKAIDYLLTGKRILVHCPADYELSQFFIKWGCGYVFNEIGNGKLIKYITDISNNKLEFDNTSIIFALNQFNKENVHSIFKKHLQNENK